jgi:type I restriction enzyme, S subunit
MSDLPKSWETSTIGDCFLDIKNGTTTAQNKGGKGIPISRIETIQNNKFDLNRIQHIDAPSDDLLEKYKYQLGDIAFSHINSFEHVGKTALYEGSPQLLLHGMNLLRLRLGHNFIYPKYAHYFMLSKLFREEVRQRVGHAVNQVSINQKNLSEVPFILPPLNEQKRIVEKLEKMLGKVEVVQARLDKIPAILKRFRQAVLAAACSGKLTADWRENKEISPVMELPLGWNLVRADEVCHKITDGEHQTPKRTDSGKMLLSAKNVRDSFIDYSNFDFISVDDFDKCLRRCNAEIDDVLIVCVGATIGRAAIVENPQKFALVRSVALLKPEKVTGRFLLRVIQSPFLQDQIKNVSQGSAQPCLYINRISALQIPFPPLEEQKEIVRRVEDLFKFADQIEARYKKARSYTDKLTQSILAKAFRGELVPQDERDEPASVLLERIKAENSAQPKTAKGKQKAKTPKAGEQQTLFAKG